MTKAILMYHRVCARTEESECYFERGTAVTPEAFRAQVGWLRERFAFRTVQDLVFGEASDRLAVALTFDDGYRDVIEHAFPVCREFGAVATVYACASTLPPEGEPLWFDRYYALVPHLRAALGTNGLRDLVAAECGERVSEPDLRWWVRGPLKTKLAALKRAERNALLERLTNALSLAAPLKSVGYLDRSDLSSLMSAGWEIGAHGAHHDRLTDLPPALLEAELAASAAMLVELAAPKPWTIAYPDGAFDERVVAGAAALFEAGVTVQPGLLDSPQTKLRLPRLLCRGQGEVPHPSVLRSP